MQFGNKSSKCLIIELNSGTHRWLYVMITQMCGYANTSVISELESIFIQDGTVPVAAYYSSSRYL